MPSQRSHLLSITLTPTTADIAEAKRTASGAQIAQRSTLVYPDGVGLSDPAALGAALADHLKATGYGTRHAVIGLCPHWVLARHKNVPPADTEALRGIVNLQIEREFASSMADMAFDYMTGKPNPDSETRPLLIVGVRRSLLQQVEQAANTAGLKVQAITPTSFAAIHQPIEDGTAVLFEPGFMGVMRVQGGSIVGLTSSPVDTAALNDAQSRLRILTDLSRCMLQLQSADSAGSLTLLLPPSVAQADAKALTDAAAERFGDVQTRSADATALLAEFAMHASETMADLKGSRLAPPKLPKLSPTKRWVIRAAAIVLLVSGTAGYLWLDTTARRDALRAEYDAIQAKAADLEAMHQNTREAEGWYDTRPPVLEVMLELTRTFPKQGEIRVETMTVRDDLTCQIECTAEDRQTMDDYFSRMRRSKALLNVDPGAFRPAGGKSTWIDLPIAFRFDPKAIGGQP